MLDKSVPYFDIIMKASFEEACHHPIIPLPPGYFYKMFEEGDEKQWAKLEVSVGEFNNEEGAIAYFERVFLPFKKTLSSRMCFIIDDKNLIIATASAWFKHDKHEERFPVLHWVATSPNHQGMGLGRAIVIYALSKFPILEVGENEIFLHTQTWSYPAVALYGKLGFKLSDEPLIAQENDKRAIPILKEKLDEAIYKKITS